jgi:hypothetical protein
MADHRHAATQDDNRGSAVGVPNVRRSASKLGASLEERLKTAEALFTDIWADRQSRWCALIGLACLWLTVALAAPVLLGAVAVAGAGIWSRREHRAAAAEVAEDDWF